MKTKTHFAFRIDIWDDTGDSVVEHVAVVDDFEVAEATYRAVVVRWPLARITLRQERGWCMKPSRCRVTTAGSDARTRRLTTCLPEPISAGIRTRVICEC
jgi:hypothetical protein